MINVWIDGAARPNPGKGGIGVVIQGESWDYSISEPLNGKVTNNVAEYVAIGRALNELVLNKLCNRDITIFSDAEMVVEQLNGERMVQKGAYLNSYFAVKNLMGLFSKLKVEWIPREENAEANLLASRGIDK